MRLALLLTCLEQLKLRYNTTWGRSNTKQSCRAHIRNDEEDIRQVASTLPGRNKKTKKMQGKINVELLVSLVSEHKELYDKRDSDYKNLDKREMLWSVIAEQMGFDVFFV